MSCSTCLSVDRQLHHLGKYSEMFMKLAGEFFTAESVNLLQVCWECLAVLRKISRFQERTRDAARLLALNTITTLSTLKRYHCKEIHLTINHEEANLILVPEQELNDVYDDTKSLDDDFVECNPEVISKDVPIDSKKEANKEKKKICSKSRWAQKRSAQNKVKVKILQRNEFDPTEVIRKVKIDPNELAACIRREKESDYYNSKPYKCNKCVIGFGCETSAMAHKMKSHSKNIGVYKCDICKIRFSHKRYLIKHCDSHFYKHECTICLYSGWSQSGLLWHVEKAHKKVYQCAKCGMRFSCRKEFYEHYKKWHENFTCDHCGRSFKMRYSIKEHIRKLHSPIVCVPCNKTFARASALWLHNKLKHSASLEKAYCVECDKEYRSTYAYRWHLNTSRSHRPRLKKSHPCPKCEKVFTKNIYMKDHFNFVHLKIYKYPCDQCNKNFPRNAELLKHRRKVHEGVTLPRNKLCCVCGRGFTHNKILANHLRTHTGERPFSCEFCPKTFAQKSALATHSKNVHKQKHI